MTNRKHITYVSPRRCDCGVAATLSKSMSVNLDQISSISELYPKLSNPKFHTDLIIVDIEGFYEFSGVGVFDIVNTVSTLIKSSVYQPEPNVNTSRTTVLISTADLNTNVGLLKEVLCSDIKGIYPRGNDFTIEEKEHALQELLDGRYHVPTKIQQMLKPKKTTKRPINDQIILTARQSQILNLIRDRGASNKAIAKILNITESTVKLHVTSILKKYGVRNRTQLALFAPKQNTNSTQIKST